MSKTSQAKVSCILHIGVPLGITQEQAQADGRIHLMSHNVVRDDLEARDFLTGVIQPPARNCVDLILLSAEEGRSEALTLLDWIRAEPILRCIPVIVVLESTNQELIDLYYDRCANCVIAEELLRSGAYSVSELLLYWLGVASIPQLQSCCDGAICENPVPFHATSIKPISTSERPMESVCDQSPKKTTL